MNYLINNQSQTAAGSFYILLFSKVRNCSGDNISPPGTLLSWPGMEDLVGEKVYSGVEGSGPVSSYLVI